MGKGTRLPVAFGPRHGQEYLPMPPQRSDVGTIIQIDMSVRIGLTFLLIAICPALAAADEISFRNDVMPVLSKAGCNAGACHGNKSGKGRFKLSLRGQDVEDDYATLTRDLL